LDLSTDFAAAWAGRLLADYGADVAFSDPHPLRDVGPFDANGVSIPATAVLANKRSVSSDFIFDLIASADVVIDDALVGTNERRLFDELVGANAQAVHVVVTPHGLTGDRAHLPGNDLTASAVSGWASGTGLADRPPLRQSGYQASYQAGTVAFAAAMSALLCRCRGGRGQKIDVALDDVSVVTYAPGILRSLYNAAPAVRKSDRDVISGPVPVKDGYFALTITRPHFWQGASTLLGLEDLAHDKRLQGTADRNAHKDLWLDRLEAAMSNWDKANLFDALSQIPVVAGPVFTMAELADNDHLFARSFFQQRGGVRFAGSPFKASSSPFSLRRGVPEPGSDASAVTAEWSKPEPKVVAPPAPDAQDGPLTGYRGVVLTQAWSGTFATELMALLGAEVIQVESRSRFDSWRGGGFVLPLAAGVAGRPSAKNSWNCDGRFNSVNLNKESVTLELDQDEGRRVFLDLVKQSDFVAENFSPRVMGKLGLDYEKLRSVKPDMIYCSISGYGHSGPWSPLPAIGGTVEPTSGMSGVLGYEGEGPLNSGQMYPDAVAGLYGFAALILALFHRERTGEGQRIDISMQEANLSFLGDRWLEYAMAGKVPEPMGNRHAHFAPHGIYPAKGQESWIAIAAESDRQWETLCDTLGLTDLKLRFPDRGARKKNEDTIDAAIATVTKGLDRDRIAAKLTASGVVAAPVLDSLEVADDPVFRHRGAIQETRHPEVGNWQQAALPCRFSATPGRIRAAAPLKGVHSEEVFKRLLGMSREDYLRHKASGITGVTPAT
jgi:crotonobetainyl-CoA:carnitine CoA-transferase CaiB-like acyl-CoA transferase